MKMRIKAIKELAERIKYLEELQKQEYSLYRYKNIIKLKQMKLLIQSKRDMVSFLI